MNKGKTVGIAVVAIIVGILLGSMAGVIGILPAKTITTTSTTTSLSTTTIKETKTVQTIIATTAVSTFISPTTSIVTKEVTKTTTIKETFTQPITIVRTTVKTKTRPITTTVIKPTTIVKTERLTKTEVQTSTITTVKTTTLTVTYTPKATYVKGKVMLEIVNSNGYIDEKGFYQLVGLIINKGNVSATKIKVSAKFYDSKGVIIEAKSTYIFRGLLSLDYVVLPPGYLIPFWITVMETDLAKLITSYNITVSYEQAAEKPKALRITESNIVMMYHNELFKYKKWAVVGLVKNEIGYNSTDTRVLAAFLDSAGNVVGVGGYSLEDEQPGNLLPGEEKAFSLKITIPDKFDVAKVILFVESDEFTMISQET